MRPSTQMAALWPLLLLLLLLTPAQGAQLVYGPSERAAVDDLLEGIRGIILHGDPERGIPVLDPLQLDHVTINETEEAAWDVQADLSGLVATGLGAFQAEIGYRISGILPPGLDLTVDLQLPRIEVRADYRLDALLGETVDIYGSGALRLNLTDANVSLTLRVTPGLSGLVLHSLDVRLGLGELKVLVTGLLGDGLVGEILSGIVNELAPELFEELRPRLETALQGALSPVLAAELKKLDWADIKCIFLGSCPATGGPTRDLKDNLPAP